jgi:hypothetical protein
MKFVVLFMVVVTGMAYLPPDPPKPADCECGCTCKCKFSKCLCVK